MQRISDSGGYEGSNQSLIMTSTGGVWASYSFQFYGIPDRLIITYEGRRLIDTGFVSGSQTLRFYVPDGNSDLLSIAIATDNQGTAWFYEVEIEQCAPTEPLIFSPDGDWADQDSDGYCDFTGTVEIGHIGSGVGNLLRVVGTTAELLDKSASFKGGQVYAMIGGLSQPLFTGDFTMTYATGRSNILVAPGTTFLSALQIRVNEVQIAGDYIGLSYSLAEPFTKASVLVSSPLDVNSLRITEDGIQFGNSGFLTLPDVKNVDFFGFFDVDISKATLSIDPAATELKLQGLLTANSPVRLTKVSEVKFDLTGDNYISYKPNGPVSLDDFDLVGDLTIDTNWGLYKGLALEGVKLRIDTVRHEINGEADLRIPLGLRLDLGVGIKFDFIYSPTWQLNGFGLDLSLAGGGIPVPMLPTLFLTGISGSVTNIAPSATDAPIFSGGMTFKVGPSVSAFSLMTFEINATWEMDKAISGTVVGKLAEFDGFSLGSYTGSLKYDYEDAEISGSLDISVLNSGQTGLFTGSIDLRGNSSGFSAYGTGSAQIPDELTLFGRTLDIPFIGDKTLGSAFFKLVYSDDSNLSNDYVAVWGSISISLVDWKNPFAGAGGISYNISAGVKVFFDRQLELIGGRHVPAPLDSDLAGTGTADSGQESVWVTAGADLVSITLQWDNEAAGPLAFQVVRPDGTTVDEADFEANGFFTVAALNSTTSRTLVVRAPDAGQWSFVVDDPANSIGLVRGSSFVDIADPELTLDALVAVNATTWELSWTAGELPGWAVLDLYADTDGSGFDGFLIASDIQIFDGQDSFLWNGDGALPGSYTLYAVLRADNIIPVQTYAPGVATVNVQTDLSVGISVIGAGVNPDDGWVSLSIEMANEGTQTANGTRIYLDIPAGYTFQGSEWGATQVGDRFVIEVGSLQAGESYSIGLWAQADTVPVTAPPVFGVTIAGRTHDGDQSDNAATVIVPLDRPDSVGFDLVVTHDTTVDTTPGDGLLTYRIVLRNDGNALAESVSLYESIQGGTATAIRLITPAQPGQTIENYGDSISIDGLALNAGQSVIFEVDVASAGTNLVTASASVNGWSLSHGELYFRDNANTAVIGVGQTTTAIQPIDLSLTAEQLTRPGVAGEAVTFEFVISNDGPGVATGVAVQLAIPAGFNLISTTSVQGFVDANGIWHVGNLRDGISRSLFVEGSFSSPGAVGLRAEIITAAEPDVDSQPGNGLPGEDDIAIGTVYIGRRLDGFDTDDTLEGTLFDDIISGLGGRDLILGRAGDDQLIGGPGNDTIYGGRGSDSITGGSGSDVLWGEDRDAVFDATASQVFRLYRAAFDRSPDLAGLSAWVARLQAGQMALDAVAGAFVGSAEFQARYGVTSDASFVGLLYNNVLDRAPDPAGLAAWISALGSGSSRSQVLRGFSESLEFRNSTDVASQGWSRASVEAAWADDLFRLYQATLDRLPEASGFLFWASTLAAGRSYLDVVSSFVASREFQTRYGATTDTQFVTLLYDNVLGRAPDAAGLASWTAFLDMGGSRAQVVRGFAQSAEFIAATEGSVRDWMRAHVDDSLSGGAGDNVLLGGMGSDSFTFRAIDMGHHAVVGLEAWDLLVMTSFGYGSASEAQSHISQTDRGAVFSDQGTEILFVDRLVADISADMLVV